MTKYLHCFDIVIATATSLPMAIVFEKVHFLIHKARSAADFAYQEDGKTWCDFTYAGIAAFFDVVTPTGEIKNAIGSVRTVRRVVDDLVAAELLYRLPRRNGISLAVNFTKWGELNGDSPTCPNLDTPTEEGASASPNMDIPNPELGQKWTPSESKSGHPASPNLDTPYNIDSESFNESLDESKEASSNEDGASTAAASPTPAIHESNPPPVQENIEPAKDVFGAIWRVAYNAEFAYQLPVSETARKAILGTMASLKKQGYVLDVQTIEDYTLWQTSFSWRGKAGGFPGGAVAFHENFTKDFLPWYRSESNRQRLEKIKSLYPDWRAAVLVRDAVTFRDKVQALFAQPTRRKEEPAWRTNPHQYAVAADDGKDAQSLAEFREALKKQK